MEYDITKNKYSPKEKKDIWDTAFGLQKVDNLEPSDYMRHQAQQHIQNKIEYADIEKNIKSYYKNSQEQSTKEADIVSLRVAELLSRNGFKFSPATLLGIHKYLFTDILPANIPIGKFRNYNITKKEDVLNWDTVLYDDFGMLNDTLEYDFKKESMVDYDVLNRREKAFSAMNFISDIWQIHPFGEGNTRTIAVFAIKYFRILGFEIDNSLFKEHSKYFRDALVLANYHKIGKTLEYLDKFTENLLLDGKNTLNITINNSGNTHIRRQR
ncbi:MAG: Fic family protein [Campylobacteraceae bacterium]|jgi:fido (protein-threonine AMPylation protein)|nr:Fic family protein [Campylobacteraceae bacterium]